MQVQIADAGSLRKSITMTWSAAELNARKAQLVARLAGEVKVNGFRPGKVNKTLLERRYGAAAQAQAEEDLGQEGFRQAISEHKLKPFGQAATEKVERTDGLVLTVSCEVFPTLALPEASAFSIEHAPVVIEDKDVEETISAMARRAGTTGDLTADETILEDDSITISGTISVDGAEVRKLHDFHHLVGGYPLFGKEAKEVVAALAGKKVGDTITFDCVLPKSFSPAESAEKPAVLSFAIQSAQRTRAKPADDALAQSVGVETLAKLRETIAMRFKERKEGEQRTKQIEALKTQLLEKVQVEVPPKALAESQARARAEAEAAAKDESEKQAKGDEAAAAILKSLQQGIILDALADRAAVQVTEDDLRQQIALAAHQTGRKPQDIADHLVKSGRTNQVAMEIREAKALEQLLEQVLAGKTAAAQA